MNKFTWNGTGVSDSITINIVLCDNCNKRLHDVDNFQCDYCWDYYNDVKFYSCHSPNFIRRRWLRICYKLRIPYKVMRFFFRRDIA